MRVRVLKTFTTANRTFYAGQIVEIDPVKESGWLAAGFVMEEKSLDGASETKVVPQKTTSTKRKTGR